MIGWLWRKITGRGTGPTRNRAMSRAERRAQIVRATLDLWNVKHKREKALEQIDRFEAMSRGYDGGPLKEGDRISLRKAHYKGWKNRDFESLVSDLKQAVEEAETKEAEADKLVKGIKGE